MSKSVFGINMHDTPDHVRGIVEQTVMEGMYGNDVISARMSSSQEAQAKKALVEILSPLYFPTIPIDEISAKLDRLGIVIVQEDNTEWNGFLTGREGRDSFALADKSSQNADGRSVYYTTVYTQELHLQWYKMPSGQYEVNGYIS